ncbi:GumC family protein [Pontibacter locisalis]|uniref:non-specific protein-tyrosine kinase n=1 Tax=Pontibacter locisalis TaxID=1719035 RepID=A0ABW5IL04_9BACT
MNNTDLNKILFKQQEEETIDLAEILYKYLVHWKWFVISFVLALGAGFLYLKTQAPIYSINSSVLIKDDKKGLGQDDMLKQLNIFSGTKVVDNEIDILKSYTLMEQVVTDLNLPVHYYKSEQLKNIELYGVSSPVKVTVVKPSDPGEDAEPLELKIINDKTFLLNGNEVAFDKEVSSAYGTILISLTGNAPDVKELFVTIRPVSAVTENYMELLTVEASSKMSTVLNMSLESAVPQKGIDILNKLVDVYNQAGLEDKNRVAANTLTFIENRLKLVSEDLTEVEKNVEAYKASEGITDISTESKLFLESVQQNDLQLNQIKIQESVLNSVYDYVLRKNNTAGTVPATLGINDPTLLALINQLVELEAKREQTVKLVKEDNPLMLAIDEQIRNVKINLSENIQTFQKSLAITRQKLEGQNARIESTIKTIPGKERKLVDITRQQAIKNNLYTFLLQKREETALSYASAVSDSRIIDRARSKNKPVSPSKTKILLLFGLVGLAVPFGIIFIKDLLNNKISSRQEIEKATKAPILAEISYSEHEEALVITSKEQTIIGEQIRALRTNLAFASPGQALQTILFTSSMTGEGKTFISLNLGASLAMIDKKTIILEMDMRKPKLHASLNIQNNLGISNYLTGQASLDEIIQPVPGQENYYIITCGTIPPNPAELLTKGRLDELFQSLRATFDYIIVDAPPVGVVTDAQILEQQADTTIYILRHNYTLKSHLPLVDSLYKESKFKNMNLVLNSVSERAGYNYGYGYGYGYTENPKGKKRKAFARA